MLSKEDFKNAGFDVSINVEQSIIDRAETDIETSYIAPILKAGDATKAEDCTLRNARLNLVYLLLLQRSNHVTRAGAKMKFTAQSSTPSGWDVLAEMASTCDLYITRLMEQTGVKKAVYNDICKIYFKTNYFSI